MWRIYNFPLNEIQPSIITLQLHLENKAMTFRKFDHLNRIINNDFYTKSMLTKYFSINKTSDKSQTLLYKEFSNHFVWNQQDKIWTLRKKRNVINRVINPIDSEKYYLQLLFNHIRGLHHWKI